MTCTGYIPATFALCCGPAAAALQVSPDEAAARIQAINEPYKLEILESIRARDPTAPITIYHIGETGHPAHWWDLCAGPHVESTGAINPNAFELESVAGAYWRGDEKNAMLQVGGVLTGCCPDRAAHAGRAAVYLACGFWWLYSGPLWFARRQGKTALTPGKTACLLVASAHIVHPANLPSVCSHLCGGH